MKQSEIKVYIIAKPQINYTTVGQWLTDMKISYDPSIVGTDDFSYEARNERATWVKFNYPTESAPGAALTELAGRRCYKAFAVGEHNQNLTQIRTDTAAYIDNILESGHGSVIEHANYTFAIEGVTRVFTAEFNRHRAGMAISEGSFRYIRPSDFEYWLPLSIRYQEFSQFLTERNVTTASEGQYNELHEQWSEIECAKEESRAVFVKAFEQMEDNYAELERIWSIDTLTKFSDKKKLTSMFRRIIGMGVATGGVWTGNLRALRHIFTMRCDPSAEEEICHVASTMLEMMMEAEPELFADFEKIDGYYRPRYRKV